MRSIKLRDMVGASIADAAILDTLAPAISLPPAIHKAMIQSYLEYRMKRGSNSIAALGLVSPWPEEFSRLYEARTKSSGLDWIDKIAKTTLYGYCPMCGSETHKTVDHFLPRSPWAEFSFLSINLVPSCGTCNTKRGNRASSPKLTVRLLHPYFDHRLLNQRLHITNISPPFAAPKFDAEVCGIVSSKSRPRVAHHLKHSIDSLEYQQFCSNRWSEARQQVRRYKTLAKWQEAVKHHLEDAMATSGLNSWRTAFYYGLLARPDAVKWLFQNRSLS